MSDLPDDELVSAVLDGEATDEEVALVHSNVALSARLAELQAARDAIATPVSLPSTEERDAAIAAALASVPEIAGHVVDLRQRRRQRALRVASVAAALLAVVGIIGAIAVLSNRGGSKSGSTTAAAPPSSSGALSGAAAVRPSSTTFNEDQAQPASGVADLGSFDTAQQLAAAAKARAGGALFAEPTQSGAEGPTTVPGPAPDVAVPGTSCESGPNMRFVARAELAGKPVLVFVTTTGGHQTLEILDLNCVVLSTQPL
jgi:hypothetical protein